jgi:hypothetical protein
VRRVVAPLIGAFLAASALLGAAQAAAASWSWSPEPAFDFDWRVPPAPGETYEGAYRVYDPFGTKIKEGTQSLGRLVDPIAVPEVPGVYKLEAWFQNRAGEQGPHVIRTLRFDHTAPLPPTLQPTADWVMGRDAAELTIRPPQASLPLAGIAGYAASADETGGAPCADPSRCEPHELDLVDGSGGSLSLGVLPEGVRVVRVVAVSGAGVASPVASTKVRIDASLPAVSLRGAPSAWSATPVQLTARAEDGLSGMAATGPLGPFTAIAVDGAPAMKTAGATATATVAGSGLHTIRYFARDAAGNVADGGAAAPQPESAIVRIDEDSPQVTFSAAQDPAEPERIEALVGDPLSGPSFERGWIGVRPAGSRGRYEPLPTQVSRGRLVARWSSDSYPAGKYEFLAGGFDLAGNQATGANRLRGGRMVLVNPSKTPTLLEASLSRRGLRFSGRLRTRAGGIGGALPVAVTEVFARGSQPSERTTLVRTGDDGRFSLRLQPGPSREVFAAFAGSRTLTRAVSERARLEVPTSVRLRASAATARIGGAPVVFEGKVRSVGAAAAAGLPVELQFRYRGARWKEFRTVESDRRGRFRYAYRFSDDDSRGVRFQFRAYVKGREGWPYGPGSSRPVAVTGR